MPSTFTPLLRLTKPGLNDTGWGTTVNNGTFELVDNSIAGTATILMTAADYTLSTNNGATDEARAMALNLTGTPGAARNVICPSLSKVYIVTNNTAGGFAQTLKTSSGTGIAVPNGYTIVLRCDGTNVITAGVADTAIPFLQAGLGAVTRTAQSKMRDIVSRNDFGNNTDFNNASVGKPAIDVANTMLAPRFEGNATDDAGTPDAVFRVNRNHVANTSPHSFRDQTTFSPISNGLAMASFDSQIASGGTANLDHTIGFQARPTHSGSGTLQDLQGYGWYPTVSGPVTNTWGVEIRTPTGSGTVTNEYGVRIRNLTKGTNKYPIFIDNNLGTNVIGAATNFNNSGIVSVGGTVKVFLGDSTNGYKSIAYNHNQNSNTYDFGTNIQSMYFGPQDITLRCADVGVAGATPSFVNILNIRTDAANPSYRAVFPAVNDVSNLGVSGFRWKEIFCTNGIINTSDARVKTEVRQLNSAEIAAAKDLAREIGAFKFLASVAEKSDKARDHIGMTVQRAIEIMKSHGLDPMSYGFICYDKWGDEYEDHPAIYHKVTNDDGEVVDGDIKDPAWREHKMKAGDLYSFRAEQLLLFIARGFEARLTALESQ